MYLHFRPKRKNSKSSYSYIIEKDGIEEEIASTRKLTKKMAEKINLPQWTDRIQVTLYPTKKIKFTDEELSLINFIKHMIDITDRRRNFTISNELYSIRFMLEKNSLNDALLIKAIEEGNLEDFKKYFPKRKAISSLYETTVYKPVGQRLFLNNHFHILDYLIENNLLTDDLNEDGKNLIDMITSRANLFLDEKFTSPIMKLIGYGLKPHFFYKEDNKDSYFESIFEEMFMHNNDHPVIIDKLFLNNKKSPYFKDKLKKNEKLVEKFFMENIGSMRMDLSMPKIEVFIKNNIGFNEEGSYIKSIQDFIEGKESIYKTHTEKDHQLVLDFLKKEEFINHCKY